MLGARVSVGGNGLFGTARMAWSVKRAWKAVHSVFIDSPLQFARQRLWTNKNGKPETETRTGAIISLHMRKLLAESGRLEASNGVEGFRNSMFIDENRIILLKLL